MQDGNSMKSKPGWSIWVALFWVAAMGCTQTPVGSDAARNMEIRLQVSGGFAGVSYSVVLDGPSGVLLGESCGSGCAFEAGDVLQTLTGEQVEYIRTLFEDAAILLLDGQEFIQCCDQFYYDLSYEDGQGTSRVLGNSGAFPPALGLAVATLHGLLGGTLPLIVDFSTNPHAWPKDPYQIQSAGVVGDYMDVTLSYGGGCRTHDVQALAWGGWMESDPVQVRLFLSHEDFQDPCDAWITRDFRFDLTPLKRAYQGDYGVSPPGSTTLKLLLADPLLASPLGARVLDYIF
jgi:hypothetical protein